MLQVNDEPKYPTFFHQFSPNLIKSLRVTGKIEVSYVGFGKKGMETKNFVVQYFDYFFIDMVAAPPVGFNLTFVCPDGQVMSYVFLCSLGKIIIMIRCSAPTGLPPPL